MFHHPQSNILGSCFENSDSHVTHVQSDFLVCYSASSMYQTLTLGTQISKCYRNHSLQHFQCRNLLFTKFCLCSCVCVCVCMNYFGDLELWQNSNELKRWNAWMQIDHDITISSPASVCRFLMKTFTWMFTNHRHTVAVGVYSVH